MGGKKPEKKDPAEKAAEAAAKAQKYMVKACQEDNVKSIESSLKKGASLTQPDEHGNTPLHVAAMYGACHAIAYLHAQGADLSVRNRAGHDHTPPKPGRTPLESATKVGEPRAISLLTALAEGRTLDLEEEPPDSEDELELPADENKTAQNKTAQNKTAENNTAENEPHLRGEDEREPPPDADGGPEDTGELLGSGCQNAVVAQDVTPNTAPATAALEALSVA